MKVLMPAAALLLLLFGIANAQQSHQPTRSEATSYINVEVRGILRKEGWQWYIEATDSIFSKYKLKVILERSEDKNRELDKFLDEHLNQEMIARGPLDCRRLQGLNTPYAIYIYFPSGPDSIRPALPN